MNLRYSPRPCVAMAALLMMACGGEGTSDRYAVPGPSGPTPANSGGVANGSSNADWQPAELEPNSPVGLHGQLHVASGGLVDAAGDPIQLKGVSTMWLNWEQSYSSSKEGLRWLRDNWGLSVVRAAMGVDETGAYLTNPNQMISQVRTVVHNAIDLGVYVLIDWHDHQGELHKEQAVQFFSQVAEEFGAYPNVFYETYNEPLRVDWSTVLKPYHTALSGAIRERDPDNVIVMGTPLWSQSVNQAADDPVVGDNLMYTVHFYSCDHKATQRLQAQYAIDKGLAIFVTEWGATSSDGGKNPNGMVCLDEAQLWHDLLDQHQISWAAWKLDDCADLSCLLRVQAPRDGGWTDQWLNGHAPFVRARMLE